MHKIDWHPKARRQAEKIRDERTRHDIVKKARGLANFPECSGVKKLSNYDYQYRLRLGRYRIFFDVADEVRIIKIQEVKKRDESTY